MRYWIAAAFLVISIWGWLLNLVGHRPQPKATPLSCRKFGC